MAGALDTLLGVPQAIGGGALDILIGDRQNVPAGEQVKRSIEALLLSGDNPANLIAIHQMNARRDQANQAVVGSPDFQQFMTQAQTHGASPMEAYDAAARLYGVHGYQPDTAKLPVDLAPGGPSAPQRQETPLLPPPSATAQVKALDARTALDALSAPGAEGEAARAAHAQVPLPTGIPQALADETLKRLRGSDSFLTHEAGVQIDGRGNVLLDYKERKAPLFPEGVSRVPGYGRFREVPTPYPGVVTVEPDPAVDRRLGAEAQAIGTAAGAQVAPGPGLKSALQIQTDAARAKASVPSGAEREKSATNTDLLTRLDNLKTTFLDAQNAKLGGALGPYIEALTGGQATGPLANWTKVPLARFTSLGTDAERKLIREQAAIENQFIQAITGAQVSWQEAIRLARQLPNMNDDPQFFVQGIDTSIENIRSLEGAKAQARAGVPGLTPEDAKAALVEARGAGQAAAAAPAPGATPGPSTLKLKSGKTVTVEY